MLRQAQPESPIHTGTNVPVGAPYRFPLKRPENAIKLFGNLYYCVRTEKEGSTWVDFYNKRSWVESRNADSALLQALNFSLDVTRVNFLQRKTAN